jgi:ATP-dependent Clp protease protease subunit
MSAASGMPTSDELEAVAALRPKLSGYSAKLQEWCESNAESRAFNAVRNGDALEISILDVIGYDFWSGGGVTSKQVKRELDANKDAKTVKVLINSPGGDVWEGIAIHSLLNRHSGNVQIEVIGLAASAASVIAMAGASIAMHEGSMMMIHPAWTIAMGNKSDLNDTAEFLAKVDDSILAIYKRRTGRDEADVKAMVEAETWMTAQQAVDEKFATAVIPAKTSEAEDKPKKQKAKAMAEAEHVMNISLTVNGHTDPEAIQEAIASAVSAAAPVAASSELTEDERQALADYRAKRDREFLDNHPLARARGVSAPPLGGMHR